MNLAFLGLAAIFVEGALPDTVDIYHQSPSTIKGCACKGECSTNLMFECNVAPVCSVVSKDCSKGTAEWSVTKGFYDYCVFPPDMKYEELNASQKKSIVMAHVVKDKRSGSYPNPVSILTGILGESVMISFDASADVF